MVYVAKKYIGSSETDGNLIDVKSPYSDDVVTQYVECDISDTKKVLEIAGRAFNHSKRVPLHQRISWLEDVANKLETNKEYFALLITKEIAKPISQSRIEVQRAIENIRLCAKELINLNGETFSTDATPSGVKTEAFYKRVPAGVVVAITPFNFPLNLVAHKIAPALGAGNTVILKPTPEAPFVAYSFAKLFIESEFAVRDALSVVYGDAEVGGTLVSSQIPRIISFTGSVQVGKIITQNAGIKKVALELGGNAATYIESSADLEKASKRCAIGAFSNSGQVCISLQRIYVDEDIYDEFAEKLAEESKKLVVGSPFNEDTFMGPLINDDAVNRAKSWVESAKQEGAKVIAGGVVKDGNIFTPTVLTEVTDDMNVICEEVFAPIVSLVKVSDFDTALDKINNSPYGLQFSIFTNRLDLTKRAINEFDCGGVVINDIPTLRFDIQPYGGVKLSGIGKEGPKYALEEMTEIKSVVIC